MTEGIFCVIDRSGSMASCLNDTIGGFNTFLMNQPPNARMTTFLFDNEVQEMYRCRQVSNVEPLTPSTYRPRGGTALLDAMGYAMKIASNCVCDTVTMVILTDGAENSSKKYTKSAIRDLVELHHQEGWKFVFLAANQDAILAGGELGIPEHSSLTFNVDNVREVFTSVSDAIERTRTGETQEVEFSQLERSVSCPMTRP